MNQVFDEFAVDLSESERTVALAAWQACASRYQPVLDKLVQVVQDTLPHSRELLKSNTLPERNTELLRLVIDSEEALEDAEHL